MTNNAKLKTVEEIRAFLEHAIDESKNDRPDTRYQLGFHAALEELERMTNTNGYNRPSTAG